MAATTAERMPAVTAAPSTSDVTRRMVCGGLAGMIAKTATNPLDRIRMLSQTGEHGGGNASVVRLYRDILRNEGVIGLWAGNGANLLRVFPAKAVVFSSNDFYRQLIQRHVVAGGGEERLSAGWSFLAGGMAGMSASLATYPLDLARGRITGKLALVPGQKTYGGIVQTVALTVKDEGLLALYRGATPTLLGAVPYEGIKFGTVGVLEWWFPLEANEDGSLPKPTPLRKMLFGGLGGVMAGLLTYPNDTVRRLLQLQGSRGTAHEFKGYWDCVLQTYRKHGIGRFYNGVTLNMVRMAPNTAVQFGSYELLKQWTADWF